MLRVGGYAAHMPYLLVLVAALASGVAVAAYTLRHDPVAVAPPRTWSPPAVDPAPESLAQGRPSELPSTPTAQTRVTGIVGLLIAVLAGAGIIAGGFYLLWEALSRALGGT